MLKFIHKKISLILLITLYCFSVHAQQTIRLSSNWEFLKQDLGSVWEAVRPQTKNGPETVPLWTNVNLPHCVNAEDAVDPDGNYYQGAAWYRTLLNINNPYNNGRTLLHFEGAGQKTEVYIYTTKVGSHVGGYDEWTVDITDAVEAFKKTELYEKQFNKKIPVSIRTDNSRDQEMIPSSMSDFNVYGGIYRNLNLIYAPSLSIDKLFVKASVDAKGKAGAINIKARFYNPENANAAKISIKIIDSKNTVIQEVEKQLNDLQGDISLYDFNIRSPKLWSTDNPELYSVQLTVSNQKETCTKTEKFGFRNFKFLSKGPFLLNGKKLLLKGTHRHEDHAGIAAAMTADMQRTEMLLIKEMGVNFIRLAHYQQSPYILDLCDSLGILVWEEIPWCRGGIGGDVYKSQARRMLINMIEQHYDHSSVIIWGLGNENDWPGDFPTFDTTRIQEFMSELNDIAHHLDNSRMTAIRRCDFCKNIPDIYSPSIWAGWYRGIYTDYKAITKSELDKVAHFLHVEWGGDSHAGRHSEKPDEDVQNFIKTNDTASFARSIKGAKDGDWDEDYICNLIDWHLKEQETMPWLTGTAQWAFKDFATPLRPDNPVPYVNQKGVVERDFTKKESYYVFQSYWASKPMVHISGHTMPVRWGKEGEEKLLKVYSNCDQAELFVNGRSAGVKKRNSQNFPAAGLHWNVAFLKGMNEIKVIAKKGNEILKDSIWFEYETEKWGKPFKAVFKKVSEVNGIATVEVKLVDEDNRQCLDAANWVLYGLAGDGKLIDDQGTTTGSRYVQLFNGIGRISIKTNSGKSVVSASVDKIPTVFINL